MCIKSRMLFVHSKKNNNESAALEPTKNCCTHFCRKSSNVVLFVATWKSEKNVFGMSASWWLPIIGWITVHYCNPAPPRMYNPCKQWNKLPTNWCRISAMNSLRITRCKCLKWSGLQVQSQHLRHVLFSKRMDAYGKESIQKILHNDPTGHQPTKKNIDQGLGNLSIWLEVFNLI